ncbi:MAG: hypothetical protein AB2L12_10590 [Smithellaceae bacterium]
MVLTYTAARKGSSLFEGSRAPVTKQVTPAAPAQNAPTPAAIPDAAKQPAAPASK